MSETTTTILTQLKIISMIRQHDKVSTRGDTVRVDKEYFQAVRRYVSGESREINLIHIAEIFNQAFELLALRQKDNIPIDWLQIELLNAKKGLENLKATYKDDTVIQAKLDVIIDQLTSKVKLKQEVAQGNTMIEEEVDSV